VAGSSGKKSAHHAFRDAFACCTFAMHILWLQRSVRSCGGTKAICHADTQTIDRVCSKKLHDVARRGKQVALDAARGLAYLHRKRIAWLDCKSSNVLLTK
jgi:hypothetical protein